MKLVPLTLLAAVLLVSGCNQTPPATEQPGTTTTDAPAAADTAVAAPAAADTTVAAAAPAAAAPAASTTANVSVGFRFKPAEDRKTSTHLLLKGAKDQDIDLGQFGGKPDVVDKEKAKLAGFPSDMLMGFRSYDAGSGTSYDLAVMNVGGRLLRIVQRKVEEQADKAPEFQTSREIPLPANAVVSVVPVVKK
ncbi:hypothetical protein [Hymenobacter lucidus]|uniref:Lipoprotein n=1 Tax=Hymenobacter lucidus TaxID=2880930 RepID=A0ABS8AU09_9BACT|nr:hypothetical protein [Hymenobacter lucidus]MCB2408894.1 hypothetical protein [Hymenobacter lucidus]